MDDPVPSRRPPEKESSVCPSALGLPVAALLTAGIAPTSTSATSRATVATEPVVAVGRTGVLRIIKARG
jgi:hypothetical protein